MEKINGRGRWGVLAGGRKRQVSGREREGKGEEKEMMDCVVYVAVMCYVQDRLIHCLPVETTTPKFPYNTRSIKRNGGRR